MSMRNKKLDMPYSQIDDVQEYVEAFDLETSEIDFNVIDEYKESPYALDASTLNSINDDINIMQNNWSEDIDETLDDKAELFQSWIDNLGEEVRPWNNVAIDKSPYLYRRSANGSLDYPFDAEVDKIIGGTVAWNQLIDPSNMRAAQTLSGVTFTPNASEGSVTINGTVESNTNYQINNSIMSFVIGHKYLVCGYKKIGNNTGGISISGLGASRDYGNGRIWNNDQYTALNMRIDVYEGDSFNNLKIYPQLIDLTALFGSAEIADYVYSLEQTTAGAGIAWLKSHGVLTKDCHAFDSGSLKSVKTSAHVTTGKNLFSVSIPTQATWAGNSSAAVALLNKLPNGTYTLTAINTITAVASGQVPTDRVMGVWPRNTNINNSILNCRTGITQAQTVVGNTFTSTVSFTISDDSRGKFTNFYLYSGDDKSNVTATFDIQLEFGSTATEYEPYEVHTYPLDSDLELRGLFKLDANNNLYAEGDIYPPSGEVGRRFSEPLDLGTLDWYYGNGMFFAKLTNGNVTDAYLKNLICTKYPTTIAGNYVVMGDKELIGAKGYQQGGAVSVLIKDSAYTDAQSFKTAMSGVYLVYELATPTTETADPYANPQIVNPLGTEEYIDTRDVPVPVGHETRYLNNDLYYYKNDIVTYSEDVGAMFLCLQDCDGSQPLPTALTVANDYWLRVYDKGKPGLNVYNLTDRGKFNWQNNYVVNDVVWMDERHINFYVCINNVSYTINNTPNYDSAHWVKLFSVYRDGMPVYWEIPNQSFFNDIYSPSVFGVAQGTSLNFDSIDVLNNITNITEEDSSLRLLENEIMLLTIYKQDGNTYNSTPILHCGTLINVPLIESGVIYKIPLNFLFYNMHMGLLCIYEEGVGVSFILAKLDNNDNVYYDIDGYIDENYFVYNKTQYESLFPNVPYIKIEFSKHASEAPILIRLINRIQTQDINNPQYIKLKTSSDAIVKEDNIVLITLNDLINDLIEENNI